MPYFRVLPILLFLVLSCLTADLVAYSAPAAAPLRIAQPRVEYNTNPEGLDVERPRFSWRLEGEGRNRKQTAYQLQVGGPDGQVWDSGKVTSDENESGRVRWRSLALRRRLHLAGPGVGRDRPGERVECRADLLHRPVALFRLAGTIHQPRGGLRHHRQVPRPLPAARALPAQGLFYVKGHQASRGLHDRPGALRVAAERGEGGRSVLFARLDRLRQAPVLPDV